MEDHWRSGYDDAVRTLDHPGALERPTNGDGVATFDATAPASGERRLNERKRP